LNNQNAADGSHGFTGSDDNVCRHAFIRPPSKMLYVIPNESLPGTEFARSLLYIGELEESHNKARGLGTWVGIPDTVIFSEVFFCHHANSAGQDKTRPPSIA
jgi:hypothetical protein